MNTTVKLSALALLALAISASALADEIVRNADAHYAEVIAFDPFPEPGDAIPGAVAWLVATEHGLTALVATSDLPPGDAVTMWWVIFNEPQACEAHPEPCGEPDFGVAEVAAEVTYAAGAVVDEAGSATFAAHHPLGHSEQEWFGNGLSNPTGAEVHLVLRTHGPVIEDRVQTMIGTFRDGCHNVDDDHPGAGDGATGPNECVDLQFAIVQQHEH